VYGGNQATLRSELQIPDGKREREGEREKEREEIVCNIINTPS